MQLEGARTLVVGATGVLGGAATRDLGARGARLALTGRDAGRLSAVVTDTGADAAYELDVLDVRACGQVVGWAARDLGGLDVVVVAHGIAAFGAAGDLDDAVAEELLAVNTLGVMALTRGALDQLGRGGMLCVVTAVLADMPMAGMAAYSASKAATSAYLTAVRREVRRSGIHVLDVRPPHMDTGLVDRAVAGDPPPLPAGHDIDDVVEHMLRGIEQGSRELVVDARGGTLILR